MKFFEILFLSAALSFCLSLEAKATSCPTAKDVQNALQCSGGHCSATVKGWSGTANGVHSVHGVTDKLTLKGEGLPMFMTFGHRIEKTICAYHLNQINTTLYLFKE